MATYFVHSGGSGATPTTDPGTSGTWTGAYATLGAAVTAATTAGDIIKVSDEHLEALSTSTTYTIGNNISIICVDHQNTAVISAQDLTNYYIGSKSAVRNIIFDTTVACSIYIYGLALHAHTTSIFRFAGNGAYYYLESCVLRSGSSSTGALSLGSTDKDTYIKAVNCSHVLLSTTVTSIRLSGKAELINWTVTAEGTLPTVFIENTQADPGGAEITFIDSDLSVISTTLFGDSSASASTGNLSNCKLHATASVLGTQSNIGSAGWDVNIYNCSSGDEHYHFAHYNSLGNITVDTGIYANDGAEWNAAAAKHSWKIVTGPGCTYYTPYVSPWIHQHHEGTSAITPSLEGLRIDNATVAQNDEVWGEFSYQGTSGFTLGTIVNDRMALLGSPANQTSTKTYSDWTASPATDTGDSVFKLATTANITPSEIGNLSARVCVGEPSITVYVDPQIRT